jgi:hypothetical protein
MKQRQHNNPRTQLYNLQFTIMLSTESTATLQFKKTKKTTWDVQKK